MDAAADEPVGALGLRPIRLRQDFGGPPPEGGGTGRPYRDLVHQGHHRRLGRQRLGVAEHRRHERAVPVAAPRGGGHRDDALVRGRPHVLVRDGRVDVHVGDARVREQHGQVGARSHRRKTTEQM
ncbi:hypothetical protein NKH77_05645 [Streptomyces sp. M19]